MKNPRGENQGTDDLTGSPELFATNLLLVRAVENSIHTIEVLRESDGVTVQLSSDERDYETETLTGDPSRWTTIRDRFRDMTEFDGNQEQRGTLHPNLPEADKVVSMEVVYKENKILIELEYVT